MNKAQLKYLLAIAECGSMSTASQMLEVSRPTLSQQIKQLEAELDIVLFERNGRKLVLTPAGEIFSEFAYKTLIALRKTERSIHSVKYGLNELITIGCSQTSLSEDIAKFIVKTSEVHPYIKFKLLCRPLWLLCKMMDSGEIDVIFSHQIKEENDFSNKYEAVPLSEHKILAVLPPKMDLGQRDSISLKDLDGQELILRDYHEEAFLKKCAEFNSYPRVICVCKETDFKIELIKQNLGIGIFTDASLSLLQNYHLNYYYVEELNNKLKEYVIYPRNHKTPALEKMLAEILQK